MSKRNMNIKPIDISVGKKVREVIIDDPELMVIYISYNGSFYLGRDITRDNARVRVSNHKQKRPKGLKGERLEQDIIVTKGKENE